RLAAWRVLEIPCRRLSAHLQNRKRTLDRSCPSRRPSQGNLSLVSSLNDPLNQFSGIERRYFQSLAPGSVSLLPAIGEPGVDVVCRPRGKIHQQLHEVELRIHLVPAAATGQAAQDRCRPSAPRVTYEERVLAVQNHTLHLSFTHIVV